MISTTRIQRLCGSLWPYKDGALKPKIWCVRQKVLGANIHRTEGLIERSIAVMSQGFEALWAKIALYHTAARSVYNKDKKLICTCKLVPRFIETTFFAWLALFQTIFLEQHRVSHLICLGGACGGEARGSSPSPPRVSSKP